MFRVLAGVLPAGVDVITMRVNDVLMTRASQRADEGQRRPVVELA